MKLLRSLSASVCALSVLLGCGPSRSQPAAPATPSPNGGYGTPPPPSGNPNEEIRKRPDGSCVRYVHPTCPPGGTCDPSLPEPIPCPPGY